MSSTTPGRIAMQALVAEQHAQAAPALSTARRQLGAVRTIERNWRLGRYQGRNSTSTSRTHDQRLHEAVQALLRSPSRKLSGLVWEEHRLALRLAEAREQGQERPELQARLRAARRELRTAGL